MFRFGANKIMLMFYQYVQKSLMNIKKYWVVHNWGCVILLIAFPFRFYFVRF